MSVLPEFPVEDFLKHIIMEEALDLPSLDSLSCEASSDFKLSSCDMHRELHIFFCVQCTVQVCHKCTREKHLDHQMIYVAEAVEKARNVSSGLLVEVRSAAQQLDRALSRIRTTSIEIDNNVGHAFEEIEAFTTRCMAAVRKRQEELLKQIARVYKIKQTNLKTQEEHLMSAKTAILTSAERLRDEYASGPQTLISANKNTLSELSRFRLMKLSPADDDQIVFLPEPSLLRDITNMGHLEFKPSVVQSSRKTSLPSSSTSPVSFSSTSSCDELQFGSSSEDETKPENAISPYLEKNSPPCICPTRFTPSNLEKGSVGLAYPLEAPSLVFGARGSLQGQLWRPWGICSDQSGNIIISDRGNNRIQIFDASGSFLKSFGSSGSNPGQLLGPTGLTTTPNDDIVVADTNNHRIQVFTNTGTFINTFGSRGSKGGQFKNPWDVACDSCGNIIVSDSRNCRIQLFTQSGTLLNIFCFPFTENRITLRGICFTPTDDVIVADYNNNCLLVVDKSFHDYWVLGSDSSTTPHLWGPQGVVCDKNGTIVVADSKNYRVKAFSTKGNLLWQLGKTGSVSGAFDRPSGMCVSTSGRLAVVDFGNSRVQLW